MERKFNGLYHKTDYVLLRTPAYLKHFDGHSRGAFYRLLCSRVYRRGEASLLYRNEKGSLTQLARAYDQKKLCAFFKDEELSEALGLGTRQIANLRKDLVENLKLVQATPFQDGWIYQVGYIPTHDQDGYDIGHEYEVFWIGKWITMAYENPVELEAFIIENVGSERQKQEFLEKFNEINFVELRNKFPKKEDPNLKNPDDQHEEKGASNEGSIEDNKIENNTTTFGSAPDKKSGTSTYGIGKYLNEMVKATTFSRAVSIARDALKQGNFVSPINRVLYNRLSDKGFRSEVAPRFSEAVQRYASREESKENRGKKKEGYKWLADMMYALKEDYDGTRYTKMEYDDFIIKFKGSMEAHPYTLHQWVWTLTRSLSDRDLLERLIKNPNYLLYVVKDKNKDYKMFKANLEQEKIRREQKRHQEEIETKQESQEVTPVPASLQSDAAQKMLERFKNRENFNKEKK